MILFLSFVLFLFNHKTILAQTATDTPAPVTNILISEFMADAPAEWVEIYNANPTSVTLNDWKLGDSTANTKPIPNSTIPAYGHLAVDISGLFLNNDNDSVKIINNLGTIVDSTSYSSTSSTFSWSKNATWCLTTPSKGSSNNSCQVPTSTNTPIPSATSVPTNTPYPTSTSAPSATSTPVVTKSLTPTITPTFTPEPTALIEPTSLLEPTEAEIQITDIVRATPTPKSSKPINTSAIISGIFIGLGIILLAVPLIVLKLKK